MEKIILILCGSFYPVHDTHIELLLTAKNYFENKNFEILEMILCPTNSTSLKKKFLLNYNFDDMDLNSIRKNKLLTKVFEFNKNNSIKIKIDFSVMFPHENKNISISEHIKFLDKIYQSENIKLIQICGVDSKISFAKNNPNALIIDNGIEIPDSNKNIIKKSNYIKQNPLLLRTCSSIERFIENNNTNNINKFKIYPEITIKHFDLKWLSDSGITLGNGVQGVVRLMFLGKLEVAVKLYFLNSETDRQMFYHECEMIKELNNIQEKELNNFLSIYYFDTIEIQKNEESFDNQNNKKTFIGYMITNTGISLNNLIKISYSYVNDNVERNLNNQATILNYFLGQTSKYNIQYETSELSNLEKKLNHFYNNDKINFKLEVINGLFDCLESLKSSNIIHRDISLNNILLNIENNKIVVKLIDFGISKKINSNKKILRGSLRYYPLKSINDPSFYDYSSDLYMTSFVIYEIIEEHEIYPECNGITKEIIKKRKKHEHPKWSNHDDEFINIIEHINNIWNNNI